MRKLCLILFVLVPLLAFTAESVKFGDDAKNQNHSPFKKQRNNKARNKGAQNQGGTKDPKAFNDSLLAIITIPAGLFQTVPPPPSGLCCTNPATLTPVIVTPDGRILKGASITVNSLSITDPTSLPFPGVSQPTAGTYNLYLVLDTNGNSVTIMTQGPIPSSMPIQINSSNMLVPQCTVICPVFGTVPPASPPLTEQQQFETSYLYNPK